jgi:D-alanyl-D-alanine-carboxypeptidase/D-alanyl-D-alanine-endopeptidase
MRSGRKKGWVVLIIAGILLPGFSSFACVLKESNITDEVKESIKERIDGGESVGIVVGFIDSRGKREYFSYGSTALSGKEPVDKNSIYEIGSITKVFTCIALADMVLNGELELDDPADKYLPESVKMPSRNGMKITLGHLATHTSAIARMPNNFRPSDIGNPYADYTVENMYEFLSGYTLNRDVGEKYEYSNLGMGLLGHILSLRAGIDYKRLIVSRICRVLGMKNTGVTLTKDMKKRLAKGHARGKEVSNWDIPALAGAGALRSDAKDMLIFLAANIGIKNSRLSAAMEMTHETRADAGNNMKVGLGWHILDNGKTKIVWHNGGTGGYRTFCGFIKEKKIGVVVLSNASISADDIGFHLLENSFGLKKKESQKS